MHQTKLESLLERTIDACTGWVIALLIWVFIITPIWSIEVSPMDNVWITTTFTAISIVRGYFWRRFFNAGIHKLIHKFVTRRTKCHG